MSRAGFGGVPRRIRSLVIPPAWTDKLLTFSVPGVSVGRVPTSVRQNSSNKPTQSRHQPMFTGFTSII